MARQRTLTAPVVVDIDGAVTNFDLVRFNGLRIRTTGAFADQRAIFQWQLGRLNGGVWEPAQHPSLSGNVAYDNDANSADRDLMELFTGAAGSFNGLFDQVLADLETDGVIKAGTESNYALTP